MRRASFICSIIIILVTDGHAIAQSRYRYAFFTQPPLGGHDSFGWGMNELGDVVGSSFLPGNYTFHATLWIGGVPIDLGTLGNGDSHAQDVNSNGWVVGWSGTLVSRQAFLWRDGHMEDLGNLGEDDAEAHGMNEMGDVVGKSGDNASVSRAFLWRDGQMENLGGLWPDRGSWAYDINAVGQVVGRAYAYPRSEWRAVLWENGKIIDLGIISPDNRGTAEAYSINDLGRIVGFSENEFGHYRATLWYDGEIYDLGRPRGTLESYAEDINNRGQVVGEGYINHRSVGFLWEPDAGMQRLDDLLPARTMFYPRLARAINDAGQIAGTASPKSAPESQDLAYIMSPVYPTLDLAAPSPGTAGVANTIAISNVTPGARVAFTYSLHGGGTRIPGCDLQQNALQLDNPTLIGSAIADENGVASITRNVPLVARGQTILFQAVVQNECAISQLVVWQFD